VPEGKIGKIALFAIAEETVFIEFNPIFRHKSSFVSCKL
jgi:hypothetical protein